MLTFPLISSLRTRFLANLGHLTLSYSGQYGLAVTVWMKGLQRKHRLNELIVGMEPTGHYWFNLANWLTEKGITVVLVNPATTKRNKENRDNSPSKSDPKDALVIADVVSRGYYSDYTRQSHVFQRLKIIIVAAALKLTQVRRNENDPPL